MKKIAILGSTGSIGKTTLEVISSFTEEFRVAALSANSDIDTLQGQINKFRPKLVAVKDNHKAKKLQNRLGTTFKVLSELEGINEISQSADIDVVVVAISGADALFPILNAIKAKKTVCLANKEAMVMAGSIIMKEARENNSLVIPIDSEESAIFQCLKGYKSSDVKRIYLTASGGPLYKYPKGSFNRLRPSYVLRHPRWKMGRKITVDSATLMNKGLEVIETHWLFDISVDKIKVVIHPEAVVHSLVEFVDSSMLAQLGITDMRLPIQYALTYPERKFSQNSSLDLVKLGRLNFDKPNTKKFPCLSLAYEAARLGGTAPCVLNASNEVVVAAFLEGRINFIAIPKIVSKILNKHKVIKNPSLEAILEADLWARSEAKGEIKCRL